MKKVFIILAVIALALLLAQIDDDLSEEAIDLVERLDASAESDGYLYVLGIFAKADDNPKLVGRHILDEYQKFITDNSYEVIDYPDSEKLPLPKGDAFCNAWEDSCFEYLFSSEIDTAALLSENEMLVFRSNTFLEFNEYLTLSKPTVSEMVPPYHYLVAAERIKVLDAVSIYKNGNVINAIDMLLEQFSALRKALALQDNIIGKMVLLLKLSEIIDVVSVILSNENMAADKIQGLDQSERSFYMISAREFGMSYSLFNDLDKDPDFFEMGGNTPGWITRMFYKPNMTINAVAPMYNRLEGLAQMSPFEFATHIESVEQFSPSTSKIRNYVGGVLISDSDGYRDYIARFNDFEAKLALFNQLHHLRKGLNSMENPYYREEKPREINGSLCLNGPMEDARGIRCLRVKL